MVSTKSGLLFERRLIEKALQVSRPLWCCQVAHAFDALRCEHARPACLVHSGIGALGWLPQSPCVRLYIWGQSPLSLYMPLDVPSGCVLYCSFIRLDYTVLQCHASSLPLCVVVLQETVQYSA